DEPAVGDDHVHRLVERASGNPLHELEVEAEAGPRDARPQPGERAVVVAASAAQPHTVPVEAEAGDHDGVDLSEVDHRPLRLGDAAVAGSELVGAPDQSELELEP